MLGISVVTVAKHEGGGKLPVEWSEMTNVESVPKPEDQMSKESQKTKVQ